MEMGIPGLPALQVGVDAQIQALTDADYALQMKQIDLPHLLWVLDNLAEGRVVNRVTVEPADAADARIALDRMIAIKAVKEVTEGRRKKSEV